MYKPYTAIQGSFCMKNFFSGYEKDQYWAGCRQSCQPGEVNPTDPFETWRGVNFVEITGCYSHSEKKKHKLGCNPKTMVNYGM